MQAFISLLQASGAVAEYTKQTAENTAFFPWDFVALFVATVSMYVAVRTWRSQRQTERNTNRLEPEVQRRLLFDMCRHLYRNLVVSYAIGKKIRPDFSSYPSEEHLLKMKVTLEDIHDELYYKKKETFFEISKLYVQLRNYNTELDIISEHLSDPLIDTFTKERDLRTLIFKCSFLTRQILWFMTIERRESQLKDDDSDEVSALARLSEEAKLPLMEPEGAEAKRIIMKLWEKKEGESASTPQVVDVLDLGKTIYQDLIFKGETDVFFENFNHDVFVEMGKNEQGGEKIHLIKLRN